MPLLASRSFRAGMFEDVFMVDHEQAFEEEPPDDCAADIDPDIFSADMDYISLARRMDFIKKLLAQSRFVTIATSPYFIDQQRALDILKELLN